MKRIIHILTLAATLSAPVAGLADEPRASSPARQMLHQLTIDMPSHGRMRMRADMVGDWTPRAVHTRRYGMLTLPRWNDARFSIDRRGDLRFTMGCNRYRAHAEMRHGRVAIGAISGTRRACAGRREAAERRILRALRDADRFEARHGSLHILDRWGYPVLVLDQAGPSPRHHRY